MPQLQYLDMPTWGSALGQFGASALSAYDQASQKRSEEDALQELIGKIQSGEGDAVEQIFGQRNLPFEQKKSIADVYAKANELKLKDEFTRKEARQKQMEKNQPLQGALRRVDEMIKIRKKGNLGLFLHGTKHGRGQAARDKGQYETLGKSLISFATTIPIRNRLEFETLSETIFDPYISDEEAYGILEKMRDIINDSIMNPEDEQAGILPSKAKNKGAGIQSSKRQKDITIGSVLD